MTKQKLLIRAISFVLAFGCGLFVGSVFQRARQKADSHLPQTLKIDMTFVEYNSATHKSSAMLPMSDTPQYCHFLEPTLREQALGSVMQVRGPGFADNYLIVYTSPVDDDDEATEDALITKLPPPRSWVDDIESFSGTWTSLDDPAPPPAHKSCNAIVRVTLDKSGTVSRVISIPKALERVTGDLKPCAGIDDVLDAARRIEFRPALKNGKPVTQEIAVLYKHQSRDLME